MNGHLDSRREWPGPGQIRAARGLLGWSQQDLAVASGTARRTVTTLEMDGSASEPSKSAVTKALEEAGVEFIGGPSDPGVRLRSK
jgi:transcriptional regulator with XRE-family HTH domain